MTIKEIAEKWLRKRYGVMYNSRQFSAYALRYIFSAGYRAGLRRGRKEK